MGAELEHLIFMLERNETLREGLGAYLSEKRSALFETICTRVKEDFVNGRYINWLPKPVESDDI